MYMIGVPNQRLNPHGKGWKSAQISAEMRLCALLYMGKTHSAITRRQKTPKPDINDCFTHFNHTYSLSQLFRFTVG